MAIRKLKPIEERDLYAAMVLSAFDDLEKVDEVTLPDAAGKSVDEQINDAVCLKVVSR